MSIFQNIFGAAKPAAPAQVTNNPAQNPPPQTTQQSAGTAPNGVVPQGSNEPPPQSPVAKFEKLWETTPPSDKDPQQVPQEITPAQMLEAASKVDFSKSINHEDLQKIVAGGESAVPALVNILNSQAKTIYGQSVVVSKHLIDQAVEQAQVKFAEQVPSLVRNHSVRDNLSNDPAFNNPAVKGMVDLVQSQLQQKFPTASASQIAAMAKEYFKGAADVFNGGSSNPAASGSGGKKSDPSDVNWDEWFSAPLPQGGDDLRS